MNIFVARQPVFMRDQSVYGYELLYPSGDANHYHETDGYKLTCLQVLKELNREELDFDALEKVIRQDPFLTYMLLKYLNSVLLGIRCQISSIKQALQGKANIYRKIFDLVVAYERGHWSEVSLLSALLQLQQEVLPEI